MAFIYLNRRRNVFFFAPIICLVCFGTNSIQKQFHFQAKKNVQKDKKKEKKIQNLFSPKNCVLISDDCVESRNMTLLLFFCCWNLFSINLCFFTCVIIITCNDWTGTAARFFAYFGLILAQQEGQLPPAPCPHPQWVRFAHKKCVRTLVLGRIGAIRRWPDRGFCRVVDPDAKKYFFLSFSIYL